MKTLNSRVAALEQMTANPQKVCAIYCKGATPTDEEQQRIDDAEARGDFVISIVALV